jgi:hypothetical protein
MANGDRHCVLDRRGCLTPEELDGFREWLRAEAERQSQTTGGHMDTDRVITNGGMSANPEFLNECREEETEASSRQVGGSHYKNYAIEPSYYILKNNIGWLEGNAIKYLTRWKDKGGRQDLEKAKHYVELLLEWTK